MVYLSFCAYMYICVGSIAYGMHVDIRGKFVGVGSLHWSCEFLGLI